MNHTLVSSLAQLHLSGSKTVKVDKNKVVTYLEKAADGDYAPAMCELGDLYFTGKLVNKNITKAIACYNKALVNGYLSKTAAANLASCYQQGLGGLPKNAEIAKGNNETRTGRQFVDWASS